MVPVQCNHQGPFKEDRRRPEVYTCAGCAQFGYGSCCRCTLCGSRLHVNCAFHKDYITHRLFPGSKLCFLSSGGDNRLCDACGKDVDGYVYHCFARGYDLHPICAFLKDSIYEPETKTELLLRKTMSSKCCNCGKKELDGRCRRFRGWGYESRNKDCCLHVSCANDILMNMEVERQRRQRFEVDEVAAPPFRRRDSTEHEFLPGRVFMFQQSAGSDRYCNACGKDVRGACYHCSDNGYDLHPTCAAPLKPTFRLRGMRAPLVLRERMTSKCALCEKKPEKGSTLLGYESMGEEYHVYCTMRLRETSEGEGTSRRQEEVYKRFPVPEGDLVARLSTRKKDGKFAKLINIVKIAVTVIISALVGDPTALIATFVATILTNN